MNKKHKYSRVVWLHLVTDIKRELKLGNKNDPVPFYSSFWYENCRFRDFQLIGNCYPAKHLVGAIGAADNAG